MGSQSDWSTLRHTGKILKELKIVHEKKIVSAHRTPKRLYEYAEQAYDRGIKIIIAGAGGSAHLPGMIAAITHIPVIGVPIESKTLKGLDSLLSILCLTLYIYNQYCDMRDFLNPLKYIHQIIRLLLPRISKYSSS